MFSFLITSNLTSVLPRSCGNVKSVDMIGFAKSAVSVLNNAELAIDGVDNGSLVHMDVDEIYLPIPSVKAAIFESSSREFVYVDNSKALFNKLVLCCTKEGGTLCFPAGSNGNYVSSATFLKADIVTVPTDANVVYSNKEIGEILSTCARFGARVIIDTSSSGLEFDSEGWGGWDLEGCLAKLNSSFKPSFCVSLLGGLSLKVLNGLRFGFVILNQLVLVDTFYSYPGLSKPHSTVRYATKKLLELREQKSSILSDAIVEHTQILRSRSKCLKEALEKSGWDVLESCAGVFVVAKLSAYLKKTIKLKISSKGEDSQGNGTTEITLNDSNIRNAIFEATGLCTNSGSWTGIPGYCRFNIAL
ncbi:hypothetical protein TSUD_254570 [Trifolium subterraneum]|uniref:Aminotransferase class I/classII large domain-containing protein n=1 Tax=Trifolium subterraneum TaxID=3900 RepID=A0A2Z6NRH8_TRISU|nr:hypothetical protein TSUD_254570 [Trifolium subterraneum]